MSVGPGHPRSGILNPYRVLARKLLKGIPFTDAINKRTNEHLCARENYRKQTTVVSLNVYNIIAWTYKNLIIYEIMLHKNVLDTYTRFRERTQLARQSKWNLSLY